MTAEVRTSKNTVETIDFWEGLYQANTLPWDIGTYAPPFQSFLESPYKVPPGVTIVLGCGTGHECLLFAKKGFKVLGVDFAPSAVLATRQKFANAGIPEGKALAAQRDIFELHDFDGRFDYVIEHTCFCAIHPSRRNTYGFTVRDLLRPGGKFIALWWLLEKGGGPPFAVDTNEIFTLFKDNFSLDLAYRPDNSVPERRGQELFTVMTKLP